MGLPTFERSTNLFFKGPILFRLYALSTYIIHIYKILAQFISIAKVSISNAFVYFSILKLAYAMLK